MYLVLLFATTLLSTSRSANVNKHMKLMSDLDSSIQNEVSPSNQPGGRRFLAITHRPLPTYTHTPGTILELSCDAVGAPAPSIHWFKNDAPVYEYDVESNEIIDSNPSSLARVVSKLIVTRTQTSDVYTCLATSHRNTARATTIVYNEDGDTALSERTKLFPLEPHIVVSYEMYVDVMGNNVVLPCKAKGHPKPHVVWKDNKGAIIKKDSRFKVLRSGELVIAALAWRDMGQFSCVAVNAFGSARAHTFLYPAKAE